jgi:hypothetical protein
LWLSIFTILSNGILADEFLDEPQPRIIEEHKLKLGGLDGVACLIHENSPHDGFHDHRSPCGGYLFGIGMGIHRRRKGHGSLLLMGVLCTFFDMACC